MGAKSLPDKNGRAEWSTFRFLRVAAQIKFSSFLIWENFGDR